MILPNDESPLIISVATTCAATVATFFLGMFAARTMYKVRGGVRAWIDGVLTLPLVLPPTVVGFFLLLIFGRRSVIGRALEHMGITIAFSWPATVIAATVIAFPLMYRTTLGMCYSGGGATRSRHSLETGSCPGGRKDDQSLAVPGAAASVLGVTQNLCRTASDRDLLQLSLGEETNVPAIGGPEWILGLFRSRQREWIEIVQPAEPEALRFLNLCR